jgi:hypothetical protein
MTGAIMKVGGLWFSMCLTMMHPSSTHNEAAKLSVGLIAPRLMRWSLRMEGYGGPAQPSPTIAQCLNGGYGWLEVKCHRKP